MTETANLGLPFIDGSQAQKHVTHNEALRILDDAIQIAVLDSALTTPPSSPADGERHIVASDATGAWTGQGDAVATWETNAWRFLAPKAGWCVWSVADDVLLVFDGSAWTQVTAGVSTLDNVPSVGINTEVAESNLLTVRSNDALINAIETSDGGTGDVRLQLSKSAEGNTSSVVFSDAFSGRAEFGLTGDDDFHLKVSADGTSWRDALKFDRTSGRVSFPSGGAREVLTADRTYYVRSADGSDSNNGLSNSSGGALLTIAKAIAAATALDLSIYGVTIQLVGSFTESVTLRSYVGAGPITIVGDETTPSNVTLTGTGAPVAVIVADGVIGKWRIVGVKLKHAGSQKSLIVSYAGSIVEIRNIDCGSATNAQLQTDTGGMINVQDTYGYTISGGATHHMQALRGGILKMNGLTIADTVTITGTPAFSTAFAAATIGGIIRGANTYSGSATGKKFTADLNGVIALGGVTLPGDVAGTTATGGTCA
jgi:hypothetical protein